MIPWYTRHRQPGQRSGTRRECLWAAWTYLVWIGNGIACGRDKWRAGFLFAHPRTIHRDRKGWPWESIEPVAGMDRGGHCLCAWAIDPNGWWDHVAHVAAWEECRLCRCNTYPSRAQDRWERRRWWAPGLRPSDWVDGMRRRKGRGSFAVFVGTWGCVWQRKTGCRR